MEQNMTYDISLHQNSPKLTDSPKFGVENNKKCIPHYIAGGTLKINSQGLLIIDDVYHLVSLVNLRYCACDLKLVSKDITIYPPVIKRGNGKATYKWFSELENSINARIFQLAVFDDTGGISKDWIVLN